MRRFLQSASIGRPQFAAAALLFVYLLQCLWLARIEVRSSQHDDHQVLRVYEGLQQWWDGRPIAGVPDPAVFDFRPTEPSVYWSPDRSPLYYLIAAAPIAAWPSYFDFAGGGLTPPGIQSTLARPLWRWLALTPYLFFGVMLGGSLWYVARRLYGNAGGYIALALFCFSPAMIANVSGSLNLAEMGAVWGAFGAVFTAIAVAHTLYAPREVVLWNWRRILLLGLSMALAAGNQFSLAPIALVALLLMLWVAPVRPRAVVAIWSAALAVAGVLLFASYFFHPSLFWQGMKGARWLEFEPAAFGMSASYVRGMQAVLLGSPPLMLALPVTLAVYLAWKRARYFGNTAPLVIALLLLIMAMAAAQFPGEGFHLTALVFLFVFVAGVFADLLETRPGPLVMAGLSGLLIAAAVWNLVQLARLAPS